MTFSTDSILNVTRFANERAFSFVLIASNKLMSRMRNLMMTHVLQGEATTTEHEALLQNWKKKVYLR